MLFCIRSDEGVLNKFFFLCTIAYIWVFIFFLCVCVYVNKAAGREMMHYSLFWRFNQNNREKERLYQERQRHILYTSDGRLRWRGVLRVVGELAYKPALWCGAAAVCSYAYLRIVVLLNAQTDAERVRLDRESETKMRATGKLKAERYLVKPGRQIEDPDFLHLPSHSGKNVYRSQLLTDDSVSGGSLEGNHNRS